MTNQHLAPRPPRSSIVFPRLHVLGALVLLVALYLLLGPARAHADIVSAVVGYTVLSVWLIVVLGTSAYGVALRRRGRVELSDQSIAADKEGAVVSGRSTLLLGRVEGVRALPLLVLSVELRFEHAPYPPTRHQFTGRSERARPLVERLVFPHRGVWRVQAARITLSDRLGLSSISWLQPLHHTTTVQPPHLPTDTLPVISSAQRSGDMVPDSREQSGDPLELRRYHPGDGMRRIVWKIFARSGELVSRHPEPSYTPEGQTALFVIARSRDDDAAAAAMNYMERLESLELSVVCGCEGMGNREIARSASTARDLLVESVWDAEQRTVSQLADEVRSFLSMLHTPSAETTFTRCVVFCSSLGLHHHESVERIITVARILEEQGVEPVLFLVQDGTVTARTDASLPKGLARLLNTLVITPPSQPSEGALHRYRSELLERCNAARWQVVEVDQGWMV